MVLIHRHEKEITDFTVGNHILTVFIHILLTVAAVVDDML